MGKPTGFMDYKEKSARQKLRQTESDISKNSMSICPRKSNSSRAPAAWNAVFRSVRPA